jgi:hypothetical protein
MQASAGCDCSVMDRRYLREAIVDRSEDHTDANERGMAVKAAALAALAPALTAIGSQTQ